MKRLYFATGVCIALLVFEAAVLLPASYAKEDVVAKLLQLPAPPPPNPLAGGRGRKHDEEFFNKSKPPGDNAPIDDLLDYWSKQSETYQDLRYNPEPSEKSLDRLMAEIDRKPELLPDYLNVLPQSERSAEFVKRLYDSEGTTGSFDKETRGVIKRWLTYHSSYFSGDLFRLASGAGDSDTYVTNHDELLALVRVDFEKARPIVDRLQTGGRSRASRALAAWALYRHALDTGSTGDTERYREELKSIVEDKSLAGPMRDLAMDALVSEKEWSGRDDWYMGLLGDESLADLGGYTGLTTLILVSPEEKYVEKMVGLLSSSDPVVRAAAIRNLLSRISTKNPEIIKAMLPWLEDAKWAKESNDERRMIIDALRNLSIPESVPGLLKVLDETGKRPVYGANAANAMSSAASAVANAANAAANAAASAANSRGEKNADVRPAPAKPEKEEIYYPYRSFAIPALARQADQRAAPGLRRILSEVEGYERSTVVGALLSCKGFSLAEQIDALEWWLKHTSELESTPGASSNTNSPRGSSIYYDPNSTLESGSRPARPITPTELKTLIGSQLTQSFEVGDDLAAAIVDRIAALDERDPKLANGLRSVVLRWQNSAINLMLLRDVKRDNASSEAVVRLLSQRKELRESHSPEIFDVRNGTPTAAGIATCLLEDAADYTAILDGDNAETKISLMACARLIRAPLPVPKAAAYVRSSDKRLALAAERYLESEDSPESRTVVLSLHPKILGATTAFFVGDANREAGQFLAELFASVDPDGSAGSAYGGYGSDENSTTEEKLVKEVKEDKDLLGVYYYDGNFVRIYAGRVMLSWGYDASRYRERELSKYEFDEIKAYLIDNHADELAPFLRCSEREYCPGKELLMLGRNGGRRVYAAAEPAPAFFAGLSKYFAGVTATPGVVKYELSKDVPGLELLLADDDLHVETVWKDGDDMRVGVSDMAIRQKVEEEIEDVLDGTPVTPVAGDTDSEDAPFVDIRTRLTVKRQFEGYSWHKIVSGVDAGTVSQPPGVELIPLRDANSIQPTQGQWKARAGAVEIRADDTGLFKLSGGKLTSIRKGLYSNPLVTPNGRWAVAFRSDDDGPSLVRFNLITNKEFPVATAQYLSFFPIAFVPTVNKVLIVEQNDSYEDEGEGVSQKDDDAIGPDPQPSEMMLLDPETGALQPASGEFRPLAQQTFRPLQKALKPNEFWAAIPDIENNETQVGIFDILHFGFRTVLRVPKITFNSMSMWVDETGGKIYFVYRGHLLSLPLDRTGH
jgi:hypothetical protein